MSDANHANRMRVFLEGRMAPWEPEHRLFIEKELAKMEIEEPGSSAGLKADYDKKMEAYLPNLPVAVPFKREEAAPVPSSEVVPPVEPKKKRTKKTS